MEKRFLVQGLAKKLPNQLVEDLISEFLSLRTECVGQILSKSTIGKFIETTVQILQFLDSGTYDKKPNVDEYLRVLESRSVNLNDDLKICCSRVARGCYSLRNKRSICHKGSIDPNMVDLKYLYSGAQWILAELVRQLMTGDMDEAKKMIDFFKCQCFLLWKILEKGKPFLGI